MAFSFIKVCVTKNKYCVIIIKIQMDKKMEIKLYKKIIYFLAYVVFGFFSLLFLYFVIYTTIKTFRDPTSLSNTVGICYILLLLIIYYIVTEKTFLKLIKRVSFIVPVFIGFIIFTLSFFYLLNLCRSHTENLFFKKNVCIYLTQPLKAQQ